MHWSGLGFGFFHVRRFDWVFLVVQRSLARSRPPSDLGRSAQLNLASISHERRVSWAGPSQRRRSSLTRIFRWYASSPCFSFCRDTAVSQWWSAAPASCQRTSRYRRSISAVGAVRWWQHPAWSQPCGWQRRSSQHWHWWDRFKDEQRAELGGQPERRIGRVWKSAILGRRRVTLIVLCFNAWGFPQSESFGRCVNQSVRFAAPIGAVKERIHYKRCLFENHAADSLPATLNKFLLTGILTTGKCSGFSCQQFSCRYSHGYYKWQCVRGGDGCKTSGRWSSAFLQAQHEIE